MYSQMQSEVHWRVCHQSAPNAQQVRVHIACYYLPGPANGFQNVVHLQPDCLVCLRFRCASSPVIREGVCVRACQAPQSFQKLIAHPGRNFWLQDLVQCTMLLSGDTLRSLPLSAGCVTRTVPLYMDIGPGWIGSAVERCLCWLRDGVRHRQFHCACTPYVLNLYMGMQPNMVLQYVTARKSNEEGGLGGVRFRVKFRIRMIIRD